MVGYFERKEEKTDYRGSRVALYLIGQWIAKIIRLHGKEQKVTWDVLLNTTVPTDSLYQYNKSQLAPLGKPSSFNSQALSQLQLLKNTGEYRHDLG